MQMKKLVSLVLVATGLYALGQRAMAADRPVQVLESLSGSNQKLIQLALPEFSKAGLKLDGYRIVVMSADERYVVLFEDTNASVGGRGSISGKPSFEVELGGDGSRVMRANFVR